MFDDIATRVLFLPIFSEPLNMLAGASVVGSKAANGGQVKTGQRMWPGTWFFYPIFS